MLNEPRYEVVPLSGALDQAAQLPPGTVVTVTSSPRRGTGATVELAERLAERGLRAVPHIAARLLRDEAELEATILRLDAAGVRDVFVIAGDSARPAGVFEDGLGLLRAMESVGHPFERVGVPSYPEGHHLLDDDALWAALDSKQAHATYTVSQLCFDADAVCRFAATARQRGISLPVVAGIPGVVDTATLLRISMRIGIGDSVRFLRGNRSAVTRLLSPRAYRPESLVRKLAAQVGDGRCELAGVHIYTFNRIAATVRWIEQAQRRAVA